MIVTMLYPDKHYVVTRRKDKMAVSSEDNILQTTQKFKKVLEKRGLEGLRKELNETAASWQNTKLNVAVTGSAGAGKSTFINVILGLDEENEAPTGVTETTTTIRPYKKKGSNVTFWDLPGVGTPNFPRDTYIESAKLKDYDFFILMTSRRFTENDTWLAKQIQILGKRYYLVRSHVGQDIRNYRRAHPKCSDPENQLGDIRDDCEIHLKKVTEENARQNQKSIHVYLIDSFMCESFDFGLLAAAIITETEGVKGSILATSLSSITQEIIDSKFRGLFNRIEFVSYQSGMRCTPDSAEIEMKAVFEHESKYYREVFEIDDDTLKTDRDLFRLSELDTYLMKLQLKQISKRMITSRVVGVRKGIKHLKKKFKSELDEHKISQRNYVVIIFDLLFMYMKCMHWFATNRFQNVPLQFASMCAVQSDK